MENNSIHYEFLIHIPFKYFILEIQKATWVSYRTSNVCVFPKLVLLWIWVTTKTYPTLPDMGGCKLLDLLHLDSRIFVIIKLDSLSGWETWPNFGFRKTCHLFDVHTQLANKHWGRALTSLGGLLGNRTCPPATRRSQHVRRPWWPGKIIHTFSAYQTNHSRGRIVSLLVHYQSDKFKWEKCFSMLYIVIEPGIFTYMITLSPAWHFRATSACRFDFLPLVK